MAESKVLEKLRSGASTLTREVERLRAPRLTNTRKRQNEWESAMTEARKLELLADKLTAIADAFETIALPGPLLIVNWKQFSRNVLDTIISSETFPKYDADVTLMQRIGLADPADYAAARAAIMAMGDPDAGKIHPAEAMKRLEIECDNSTIPGYFPTPEDLATRLVGYVVIRPQAKVLEPSAGKGSIADVIREHYPEVQLDVCEWNRSLRDILLLKGYNVVGDDVFKLPKTQSYDVIIQNPPFEKGADMEHVRFCFEHLLAPDGELAAVMSEGPFFRDDKASRQFREWFEANGGAFVERNQGAFKDADRSTGVSTCIIHMSKEETRQVQHAAPAPRQPVYQPGQVIAVGCSYCGKMMTEFTPNAEHHYVCAECQSSRSAARPALWPKDAAVITRTGRRGKVTADNGDRLVRVDNGFSVRAHIRETLSAAPQVVDLATPIAIAWEILNAGDASADLLRDVRHTLRLADPNSPEFSIERLNKLNREIASTSEEIRVIFEDIFGDVDAQSEPAPAPKFQYRDRVAVSYFPGILGTIKDVEPNGLYGIMMDNRTYTQTHAPQMTFISHGAPMPCHMCGVPVPDAISEKQPVCETCRKDIEHLEDRHLVAVERTSPQDWVIGLTENGGNMAAGLRGMGVLPPPIQQSNGGQYMALVPDVEPDDEGLAQRLALEEFALALPKRQQEFVVALHQHVDVVRNGATRLALEGLGLINVVDRERWQIDLTGFGREVAAFLAKDLPQPRAQSARWHEPLPDAPTRTKQTTLF